VLSTFAGTLWVDPFGQATPSFYVASALLFLTIAGLILYLVDALRTAQAGLREHEKQLATINRELKHRIKNLFAITDAICQQTIRGGGSLKKCRVR
jgi:hypothetical protein